MTVCAVTIPGPSGDIRELIGVKHLTLRRGREAEMGMNYLNPSMHSWDKEENNPLSYGNMCFLVIPKWIARKLNTNCVPSRPQSCLMSRARVEGKGKSLVRGREMKHKSDDWRR